MTYWDKFKQFLSSLGRETLNIAFPIKGSLETNLSVADQLRKKGEELYQKASLATSKEEKAKYFKEATTAFQQASSLAQQTQRQTIFTTQAVSKLPEVGGFLAGGPMLGAIGGAIGSIGSITTKQALPSQFEEVEQARAKFSVEFYKKRYPEAKIPEYLPILEQEKLYKEYAKARSQEKISEEQIVANPKTNLFLKTAQLGVIKTVKENLVRTTSQIAENLGLSKISTPLLEKAEKIAKEAEIFQKKAEIPDVDEVLKDIKINPIEGIPKAVAYFAGQAFPYMATIIGGAMLFRKTPIAGGALLNYAVIRGGLQKELEEGGVPRDKASDYATVGAWIEAQIEEGFGIAPDKLARWFPATASQTMKSSFRRFLISVPEKMVKYFATLIEEGSEEVVQHWTEVFIKRWLNSKETQNITIPQLARESVVEFIGGFLGAIPFGATEIMTSSQEAGLGIKSVEEEEGKQFYNYKSLYGNIFKSLTKEGDTYYVNYYNPETRGMLRMPFKNKEQALEYIKTSFISPPASVEKKEELEKKLITQEPIVNQLEKVREERLKIGRKLAELREAGKENTKDFQALIQKYEELGDKIHQLTLTLQPTQPTETIVEYTEEKPAEEKPPELSKKISSEKTIEEVEISPPATETPTEIPTETPKEIPVETPTEELSTPKIKITPQIEKEYNISISKRRLAELLNIPLEQITPYEVQKMKPLEDRTKGWFNTLSEEQIKHYLLNPDEIPAEVDPIFFLELTANPKLTTETKLIMINSELFEPLNKSGRTLSKYGYALHHSPLGWYVEANRTKQEKIQQIYHKEPEVVVEEASKKLLETIQKEAEKGISIGNPKLYNAFVEGKLNIWELFSSPYEVQIKLLAPYFDNPIALRQAVLELEEKQFLKHVERGLKNWIDKYSQANRYSPEKIAELEKTKQEFLEKHGKDLQALKTRKQVIKNFAKIITGYSLSLAEIEELSKIVDIISSVKVREDFLTLPPDHPVIQQFALANVAYQHYLLKLKGAYQTLGQWSEEFINTLKNAETMSDQLSIIAKTLNDLFISLKAQLDNSFILRQGMHTLFRDPSAWLKGVQHSFQGMFSKVGEDNHLKAVDSIFYDYYTSYLYRLGYYDNAKVKITYAELYPTDIPAKIPIFGEGFKRSQAAYTLAQFTMRRKMADTIWNQLQGAKIGDRTIDFLNNKEDIQQVRYMINVGTSSGFTIKRGLPDFIVWSKNIILADIRTLADATYVFSSGKGVFKTKNFIRAWSSILGRWLLFAIINALIRSIYKDADKNPAFIIDPTDQRFGTVYLPKGAGRISNPLLKLIHILAVVATGTYKSANTRKRHLVWTEPGEEVSHFLWSYFESKFTPGLSVLVQLINRKNFRGEKITATRALMSLIAPISIENILEIKNTEEENRFWATVGVVADIFGLSATTFIRKIKLDNAIRSEVDRLQQAGYEKIQNRGLYDGFVNEFQYLTAKENDQFFKGATKLMNLVLNKVITSPIYRELDDATKAELLAYTMDKVYNISRTLFIAKTLKDKENWSDKDLYNWIVKQKKTGLITSEMLKDLILSGAIKLSVLRHAIHKALKQNK